MTDAPTPPAAARPLVQGRGLRFRHPASVVLDGVDFDIARGRVTAVLGPSGCGKTTLLKLIGGQLRPDAGQVQFDGTDVHALAKPALFELRQRMGMMFQGPALLTDLTVFENVAFPLREHTRLPEPMIRDLVLMKLHAVGLRGARDLYPSELSGGMLRRVAFARAIALDPDLVMYDEPFAGQDPVTLGALMRVIRALNESIGVTAIVVSHSVEEALAVSHYAYVLSGGRVVEHGTPDQVRASRSEWVQQFLQGKLDGPTPFHLPAPPAAGQFLGA